VDRETERHIDTKVEAVKAQNDARFAEVLAGIDKVNSNLSAFGEIVRVKLDAIDGDMKSVKVSAQRTEDTARNTRWNIAVTGLTVFGMLLAAWAIWVQGMELITSLLGPPKP
jgi:hypothetical protein